MRIRFIQNYFYPDLSSVSQIVSDIAFSLSSRGHTVSVITSRNRYTGGGQGMFPAAEVVRGVSIRRVWAPSLGKGSVLARLTDQICFMIGAAVASLCAPRADTVVFLTNPPLFAVLGLVLKRFKGEQFVYVVMDLYPDIAIRSGLLKAGSFPARMMARVTAVTLKRADRVVVLGTCMRDAVIVHGVDRGKMVIIRNWADQEAIRPLHPTENTFRTTHGLEGQFVVMYSGNMGVAHRFDDLLEVARRLRDQSDIRFVFIGDGMRRDEVAYFQTRHRLKNVLLLPYQDRARLAESLGAGDLHFVTLREGFEGLVVPSKIYSVMAAGRPVVYQGSPHGDIARMIVEKDIGIVVPEGDANALQSAILRIYHDRALADLLGKRARAVLEQEYSMEQSLEAYEKMFRDSGEVQG